ncbi:23S rRNA (adenine(2503)-C(2))-methyltransferase RlmN [Pelagibacterium sp.]|uniref:23S rRNA (adenine(2503)-C(2))-methyltransferase RlmN n=1 Tax=Pelagibacterium sp. TaxID=1967288 RepID=UPI003A948478
MSSAVSARTAGALVRASIRPFALDLDSATFARLPGAATMPYSALFSPHANLPKQLRHWGNEHGFELRRLTPKSRERGNRSEKHLFALPDGYSIETVLIRRRDGYTACVSSQVGCAFACRFCASGQAGLKRNLTAGEIVEQVVRLGPRANRVVFMGIGEPLNNYENVLKAIRILRDRAGLALPASGMTISTIGIPKALKALREEHLKLNLTISLHATTQQTRAQLIPGAKKHDIAEVVSRALAWAERHNRIVTFVYLVLAGINDTSADLERLCDMFAGRPARINLMRWNPVDGVRLGRTNDYALSVFRHGLERAGVPVVVRDTQGRDIAAACGQLWLRDIKGQPVATR